MTTVADLIATLDTAYPPGLAQSWDSVGLVCGEPQAELTRVLFAVDATAAVVDAALDWNAQALVVHHPLLLRGVDTVAASTPKGALLHRLIRGGCALFTAHTNADSANPGVSDALATTLGLRIAGPLDPKPEPALDKWSVQVPLAAAGRVAAAMFAAGAGTEPGYEQAAWRVTGTGQFRPVAGAHPAIGTIGTLEHVAEERIDTLAPRHLRTAVLAALRAAHPYESPGFHISERAPLDSALGIGRIGTLAEPETLRAFTDRVARALPATTWGVRAAGDPDRIVRTVAVCGGAGDSLLAAATRAGADAYVTSDLRHHPVDEQLRAGGPALVDVAHWASEFPWCAQASATVAAALPGIETQVCPIRTDPWTLHAAGK